MRSNAAKIMVTAALSLVLAVSLVLRIKALSLYNILGGDTAVFALMAKHIYQLKEFPAYLLLNHYAGALASYIGALLFALFGVSFVAYSLTGLLFSLCWVFFVFLIAKKIHDLYGFIASVSVVLFPASLVLFYSLFPGGVHAESLLFGAIVLFLLIQWNEDKNREKMRSFFLLGFFSGFGMWLSPGIFPFFLTVLTVFFLKDKKIFLSKKIIIFSASLLLGHMPAIIHNLYYPGATLLRLGGRFLELNRAALSSGNVAAILAQRLLWRMSTIPASLARVPFLFSQLVGLFSCAFFFIAAIFALRLSYIKFSRQKIIDPWLICSVSALWLILFYAVAVGINSGRYVLSLYVVFPFIIGKILSNIAGRSRLVFGVILIAMVTFNIIGIHKAWREREIRHYSTLSNWLKSRNFYYGFSDYSTGYSVIFQSDEQVLLSPTVFPLSYGERYPAYTASVRNSKNPVYVMDVREYPKETQDMERQFARLGVNYSKEMVEEFAVYHSLSRRVYPEELNLSEH